MAQVVQVNPITMPEDNSEQVFINTIYKNAELANERQRHMDQMAWEKQKYADQIAMRQRENNYAIFGDAMKSAREFYAHATNVPTAIRDAELAKIQSEAIQNVNRPDFES